MRKKIVASLPLSSTSLMMPVATIRIRQLCHRTWRRVHSRSEPWRGVSFHLRKNSSRVNTALHRMEGGKELEASVGPYTPGPSSSLRLVIILLQLSLETMPRGAPEPHTARTYCRSIPDSLPTVCIQPCAPGDCQGLSQRRRVYIEFSD